MTRGPLVLAIRDLTRRPGARRDLLLDVPAPPDLGTVVIGVPAGSEVHLALVLESAADGVLVTGRAEVVLEGECVRCLEPLRTGAEVSLTELYLYPEALARAADDGDEDAAEMLHTDGETLDLEPMLRDAVVTSLPFRPLCSADCPGLCPTCGIPLRDAEPGHFHETIDPRFKVLEDWHGDAE
ncbi:MAG: YceD family protein [Actinomycetota bacterium]